MSGKKEVTVGITINLDNYENLRIEVEGDVETHEDVDDLIMFLDGMLARLGRSDPATTERIDAYRRRVLKTRPAEQQASSARPVPEAQPVAASGAGPALHPEEKAHPSAPEPPRVFEPPARSEAARIPSPEAPGARPAAQPEVAGAKPSGIPAATVKPPVSFEPPVRQEATPGPAQQPEAAAAKPPVAPAGDVCEVCGAEVTRSQAKLSQLFMSKKLCKKCMEHP